MQVQSLSLRPKRVGALPLVDHFLRPLDLPKLFAAHIPNPHYVAALELLVKSVLLKPSALYRIEAWAHRCDPAWLPAGHFGDDVLGRALDRLFEADRASLMTSVVIQALRVFEVQTDQIHNDSTSIKFCGAYAHQKLTGVQLCRGFSKDHRPDLKQLVYCLSVSADGAVPVHFKAYSGNQPDDPTHWETWQCLGRLLGKTDFLYVADCKLCALQTLRRLDEQHGRFITIVPHDRKEIAAFAEQAAAGQVQWELLWERRACRGQRRESFELAAGARQFQASFPLHWYRSSEKQRRDAHERQGRIQAALRRLQRLKVGRGRGPKTAPAIRRKAEQILAHYHVQALVQFHLKLQPKPSSGKKPCRQRSRRRAPGAVPKVIPVLSASPNPAAIARAATLDGTFPLVTNTDLPPLAVLQKYKYQPHLEKRHRLNKTVLEIAPGFLKKNTRIEALMLVYFIADLVAALLERTVRQNMVRRAIPAIPILPEGRDSKTPTYEQIVETFDDCTKNELYEHDQFLKAFVTPLTEIQRSVLDLLDIDATVYE